MHFTRNYIALSMLASLGFPRADSEKKRAKPGGKNHGTIAREELPGGRATMAEQRKGPSQREKGKENDSVVKYVRRSR